MTTTETIVRNTGRSLVPGALFERLSARIVAEHPDIDRPMAERIMDQALAFLATVGRNTGELSPSEQVDIAWHTFVLHTREYADFCSRIAGCFIHHEPHDDTRDQVSDSSASLIRTLAAITAAGFVTDPELWAVTAKCSDRCSGSGQDGNENTETQIPPPVR